MIARHGNFNLDDGLEDDRPGLLDGCNERFFPGRDEGNFLGVNGMVFAVVNGDPNILHCISGDCAGGQYLAHSFFDRRYELVGNRAANDLVDEFETLVSRQRFDAQKNFAKLAGAAGLFLVTVVTFRLAGDGFAIRDAGRPSVYLDVKALFHALHDRAQVKFAAAAQDSFVGGCEVLHDQAGVFRRKFCQRFGQFLFVTASFWRDRDTMHRRWTVNGLQVEAILVMRIMQHRVEFDFIHFCYRTNIARNTPGHFDMLFPLQAIQMGYLERLACIADKQLAIRRDRALVNTENSHAPDKRVDHDLEHMGDHMFIGIRLHFYRLGIVPLALDKRRRVALHWIWH